MTQNIWPLGCPCSRCTPVQPAQPEPACETCGSHWYAGQLLHRPGCAAEKIEEGRELDDIER